MFRYSIDYNINFDIANWYGAINEPFEGYGFKWIDNVTNSDDYKMVNQIEGLSENKTGTNLKPYLENKLSNQDSQLNKFIRLAQDDFSDKYNDACLVLEKITGHKLMSNKFTFYITTFPRVQYFYDKRIIMMYDSTKNGWGMPIDNFLHEALHFQFIYYYRNNHNSPVSKLAINQFEYLKEALTVVLDDSLKPLATIADQGYST